MKRPLLVIDAIDVRGFSFWHVSVSEELTASTARRCGFGSEMPLQRSAFLNGAWESSVKVELRRCKKVSPGSSVLGETGRLTGGERSGDRRSEVANSKSAKVAEVSENCHGNLGGTGTIELFLLFTLTPPAADILHSSTLGCSYPKLEI